MIIFRMTERVPSYVLSETRKQVREQFGENAIVLSHQMDVVSMSPPIPDAICRFCAVANLTSSIWCVACGAPLTRQ